MEYTTFELLQVNAIYHKQGELVDYDIRYNSWWTPDGYSRDDYYPHPLDHQQCNDDHNHCTLTTACVSFDVTPISTTGGYEPDEDVGVLSQLFKYDSAVDVFDRDADRLKYIADTVRRDGLSTANFVAVYECHVHDPDPLGDNQDGQVQHHLIGYLDTRKGVQVVML